MKSAIIGFNRILLTVNNFTENFLDPSLAGSTISLKAGIYFPQFLVFNERH